MIKGIFDAAILALSFVAIIYYMQTLERHTAVAGWPRWIRRIALAGMLAGMVGLIVNVASGAASLGVPAWIFAVSYIVYFAVQIYIVNRGVI